MAASERITCIPTNLKGQPTIRLPVLRVIEALAVYPNWDELRREYPELESGDIRNGALAALAQWPAHGDHNRVVVPRCRRHGWLRPPIRPPG